MLVNKQQKQIILEQIIASITSQNNKHALHTVTHLHPNKSHSGVIARIPLRCESMPGNIMS